MECSIRKWKIEDASDLATVLNNKNIHDNLRDGLPYPYTEEDAKDFIHAMIQSDENTTYAFAITVEDKAIGSIGVFRKDNIHARTAEMGYYIAEVFWGQGIGTSAIKQICKYIFEQTNIVRIFAEPFAHNTASCRILEKSGFVCEGILRSNAVKNGQIIDMKMYSLIKASDSEEILVEQGNEIGRKGFVRVHAERKDSSINITVSGKAVYTPKLEVEY